MSGKWAVFEDVAEAKGYTQISNLVMRSPKLSMPAKYLYGLLKSYAWEDPDCHPGVKRLCRDAGCSKDTLAKYMHELVDAKLIEVKRRGRGMTNLYVFKRLTNGLEGDTGSHLDGDTGSVPESDTGSHNEDSVNEDSVTTSRRDAGASHCKEEKDQNPNWMDVYCQRSEEVGLPISEEDRKRIPSNLARCAMKEKATAIEMNRLIAHLVQRRLAGVVLSPQEALKDIRGVPRANGRAGKPSLARPTYEYLPELN